jgi:hypothetical protein
MESTKFFDLSKSSIVYMSGNVEIKK